MGALSVWLTRVQGSDGSVVVEVAAIVGHAMFQKIVVEGKRRRILDAGGVVAGPTALDWAAVGAAGPAGPVQRGLQRRVLRVVLRHAPQLLRRSATATVAGTEAQKEEERKNEAFWGGHCGGVVGEWRKGRKRNGWCWVGNWDLYYCVWMKMKMKMVELLGVVEMWPLQVFKEQNRRDRERMCVRWLSVLLEEENEWNWKRVFL